MARFFVFVTLCCGLVLTSHLFSHSLISVLAIDSLPMPTPESLAEDLKIQIMEYLGILIENVIPAVGFSLVVRKLTS